MKQTIKRNAISVKGICKIKTSSTDIGGMIHATKNNNGWTLLDYTTGKYYHCSTRFIRECINITETIEL